MCAEASQKPEQRPARVRAEVQQQPRAGPTELLKPELYVSAPQGLYPAPLTPAQTAAGTPGAKVRAFAAAC